MPNQNWDVSVDNSEDKSKMVLVWRKDLKVPKGKIGAQLSHAAVGATIQALFGQRLNPVDFHCDESGMFDVIPKTKKLPQEVESWFSGEFTKITVSVDNLEELEDVEKKATEAGLNVCKITDNGHTCFDGVKTVTCLAIGPCKSSKVDPITGNLKLF